MLLVFPPYIQGILYSFVFLLALGPAFFYLLTLSITKGFRSGAMFALGIVVSDVVIMATVYYGLGALFESNIFQAIFNCLGGVVLVFLGVKFLLEKEISEEEQKKLDDKSLLGYGIRGFLMNISNPFAFIVWITVRTTILNAHPNYQHFDYMLFFCGLFGAILFMEVSKAYLADKIGRFLTTKVIFIIHKLLGIVFVCIGLWLFYKLYDVFY